MVGLNVAVKQEADEDLAVYLSGNGPLVAVLTEALTRDKQAQEKAQGNKITKKEAEREVKRFIQIIHRYRDNMLGKVHVVNGELQIDPLKELKDKKAGYGEVENIAIFDEAQRSWDKEHIASWLKRKKGFADFPMSEGEFLIWSLDQRKDWAVIVCLVGGGQEINTGEAGIGEWIRALNETFPHWQVYISDQLTAKEYAEGKVKVLLEHNPHVTYSEDLHLAVSMRSFRAESLSNMVHYLLDSNVEKARETYATISDRYPIALTRNLDKAKVWLKQHARGNERYGLVVSSKAYRLKPLAIDVRCKPDTVHWFLDDINDVRSSLFMEDAARVKRRYPDAHQSAAAEYAHSILNFRQGRIPQALQQIDDLIKKQPQNPYFYELKGQFLFESGQVGKSIAAYETALRLRPDNAILKTYLAQAMLENNPNKEQLQRIILLLQQAQIKIPTATGWQLLSRAYDMSGRRADSLYAAAEFSYEIDNLEVAQKQLENARKAGADKSLSLKISDLEQRIKQELKERDF